MELNHLSRIRRQLLEARAETERMITRINETGLDTAMSDSISELSSYDNHPGDLGSEMFERSKDFALRESCLIRLHKIDESLDRIEAGTYGVCDQCGQPIDIERLEAEPEARLCLSCKQRAEEKGTRHPRPIEEDVIVPPFGGLAHDTSPWEQPDAKDEIMFDGEDAWQEVARWNEHAPQTGAGSYYGTTELDEDRGIVEKVEGIPYFKGADGVFYEDTRGLDDEDAPREREIGDEGWDQVQGDH